MLRPRVPDPAGYQQAGTRLFALAIDLATIAILVYGVLVWNEDLSINAPAFAAAGLAVLTDTWEFAALTRSPSQVRRAWAPFLYLVDGAAFLVVLFGLFFIFWASLLGNYITTGKQIPYSWGINQTITWSLLSAVGVLRFFFVVLSCTDHHRMRRARRDAIRRLGVEMGGLDIGRHVRSTRPPEVSLQQSVPLGVIRPAGKTANSGW